MAKKESTFLNMVLTLLVVTGIASLALGGIYNLTKEPIAAAKKARQKKAIEAVIPSFNELKKEVVKPEGADRELVFNYGLKGDTLVGIAVSTYTNKGYSGLIRLMVGFNPDGGINNVSVLEHSETPGLGTKMTEPGFKNQFVGKYPDDFELEVKKDGGDVDAITAATISSRAFCDAVQRAYDTFKKQQKEGGPQE